MRAGGRLSSPAHLSGAPRPVDTQACVCYCPVLGVPGEPCAPGARETFGAPKTVFTVGFPSRSCRVKDHTGVSGEQREGAAGETRAVQGVAPRRPALAGPFPESRGRNLRRPDL